MSSSKNAGRRRFITREHTSDTSEADTLTARTPEGDDCGGNQRALESINLLRDAPSAFVRVKPSSKSAALERTFRENKNGLALTSVQRLTQQPTLVPTNSEHNPQFHVASERIINPSQRLTYTPRETSSCFLVDCDDSSLGFRPIHRDSIGSESSSLAGSTVDSELTISNAPEYSNDSPQNLVKPPPHPSAKDATDSNSKLRPWSYYDGVPISRTVLSSTGSASSYDNLDKTETLVPPQKKNFSKAKTDLALIHALHSPNLSRMKHFESTPKRTPSPPNTDVASGKHSDAFRGSADKQMNASSVQKQGSKVVTAEEKAESARFLEGVCRRRMAGGHVQVIPPLLVGVFDPSRIIQTNAHVPADLPDSSSVSVAPAHGMSSARNSEQSIVTEPSESFVRSLVPHATKQQHQHEQHVLNVHPKPFVLQDPGFSSSGRTSGSTAMKIGSAPKPYRAPDESTGKDSSSKSSSIPTSENKKNRSRSQDETLSSVNDLFHYVMAGSDATTLESHQKKQEKLNSKKKTGKAASLTSASRSSPPNSAQPSAFKSSPKWQYSSLPKSEKKHENSSSPKGSPKWEYSSLSKSGKIQEQTSPKSGPKWEYSPLSKGGKAYDSKSSPKSSPKHDQTFAPKSSPLWGRLHTAESGVKYQKTSSPKSSPKSERASSAKSNEKMEKLSSKIDAKVKQVAEAQQLLQQNMSRWETSPSGKINTAFDDKLHTTSLVPTDLEPKDVKANILKKCELLQALDNTREAELSNVQFNATEILRDRPRDESMVSGDGYLQKTGNENDKRRIVSSQTQCANVANSVFTARRKKQFSSPSSPPSTQRTVERSDRNRKCAEDARKIITKRGSADSIERNENVIGNKSSLNESPKKTTDHVLYHSDAASDRTSTSSSTPLNTKSIMAPMSALNPKSESGESDAVSVRSAAENTKPMRVSPNLDIQLEHCEADVNRTERKTLDNDAKDLISTTGSDAKLIDLSELKGSFIVELIDVFSVFDDKSGIDVNEKNPVKGGSESKKPDDEEIDIADTICLCGAQNTVHAVSPQTRTFTDISESISVTTQPTVVCAGNSSEKIPCSASVSSLPQSAVSSSVSNVKITTCNRNIEKDAFDDIVVFDLPQANEKAKDHQTVDDVCGHSASRKSRNSSSCEESLTKSRKFDPAVRSFNNNSRESSVPTDASTYDPAGKSNLGQGQRSFDSLSSSSLQEGQATKEGQVNMTDVLNMIERVNQADDVEENKYPNKVEKAIFTVDKEISFVSWLPESESDRSSIPKMMASPASSKTQSGYVDESLHKEPLASSPKTNIYLISEQEDAEKPIASCLATPPTDTFLNVAINPINESPSAFQTTYLDEVTMPSQQRVNLPPVSQSSSAVTTMDSSQINNVKLSSDFMAGFACSNEKVKDNIKSNSNEVNCLNNAIDRGGGGSAAASQKQITYKNIELAKPLPHLSDRETPIVPSITSHSGPSNILHHGEADAHKHPSCSDNRNLSFPSKESYENVADRPESEQSCNMSPVFAALDDALAVLSSVVMENKITGDDTHVIASAEKSLKVSSQQDTENVIHPNTPKKGGRSKHVTKEALSTSKRRMEQSTCGGSPVGFALGHHSDPLEVMDIVRQEIQTVENRRHQLVKEDSFNRPDSPMFHETLPLPKDSIIKRNREHCRDSTSSSESGGSPQVSPRLAPRCMRRTKRTQPTNKLASLPASEASNSRSLLGVHGSCKGTLSRHQSDIFLDSSSFPGTILLPNQHLQKSRRHNSDSADSVITGWPKTISLAQGIDTVSAAPTRNGARRTDHFLQHSDLQQSLLQYNQLHGGRRGQSWMQTVDACVKEAVGGGGGGGGGIHPTDKPGKINF